MVYSFAPWDAEQNSMGQVHTFSITTTHFLQDTGCVAFPFVDVHPQTIAATLAVSSVPEAVTQAVVVILAGC